MMMMVMRAGCAIVIIFTAARMCSAHSVTVAPFIIIIIMLPIKP
jgi:hypothetical protein